MHWEFCTEFHVINGLPRVDPWNSKETLPQIFEIQKKLCLRGVVNLGLRQAVLTSFLHGKWGAGMFTAEHCWLFSFCACFGCRASILIRQCLRLFLIMGVNFVLVYRKHLWMKYQAERPRMRECDGHQGMERELESMSLLLVYWGIARKDHASCAGLQVPRCPLLIAKMAPIPHSNTTPCCIRFLCNVILQLFQS